MMFRQEIDKDDTSSSSSWDEFRQIATSKSSVDFASVSLNDKPRSRNSRKKNPSNGSLIPMRKTRSGGNIMGMLSHGRSSTTVGNANGMWPPSCAKGAQRQPTRRVSDMLRQQREGASTRLGRIGRSGRFVPGIHKGN